MLDFLVTQRCLPNIPTPVAAVNHMMQYYTTVLLASSVWLNAWSFFTAPNTEWFEIMLVFVLLCVVAPILQQPNLWINDPKWTLFDKIFWYRTSCLGERERRGTPSRSSREGHRQHHPAATSRPSRSQTNMRWESLKKVVRQMKVFSMQMFMLLAPSREVGRAWRRR